MKKSFPPFYMNVKHVLFTTSATRFDLFEEIVTLVVYQDKCWKIFHFDLPDRFHAQFGIFHTFDALDVVLGQNCSRTAYTSQIETTIFLASIRHLVATVTFRQHDHATAMTCLFGLFKRNTDEATTICIISYGSCKIG